MAITRAGVLSVAAVAILGCGSHEISGTVTGAVRAGVLVTLGGDGDATTTTAADGSYAFTGLRDGAYRVTPSHAGHAFDPPTAYVAVGAADVTVPGFSAIAQPGALDGGFGVAGTAGALPYGTYSPGTSAAPFLYDLAVQDDGKVVVVGDFFDGWEICFAALRFLPDGAVDRAFGAAGLVAAHVLTPDVSGASGNAVAIQPDGKIVAVGIARGWGSWDYAAVVRWEADGRLDATFGEGGVMGDALGPGAVARDVAVQPDGKLVVAGEVELPGGATQLAVARLETDGSLDAGFGEGGIAATAIGGWSTATAVALQPDGKIVAAGESRADASAKRARTVVARYGADGTLDAAFADGGIATAPAFVADDGGAPLVADSDGAAGIAIGPAGEIVAAVTAAATASGPAFPYGRSWLAVARWNGDGSVDGTFGASAGGSSPGTASAVFGARAWAAGVALLPDGKIVVGGTGDPSGPADPLGDCERGQALARFQPDGAPDESFGDRGRVQTRPPWCVNHGGQVFTRAVALQADGKVLVGGNADGAMDSPDGYVVSRYWP